MKIDGSIEYEYFSYMVDRSQAPPRRQEFGIDYENIAAWVFLTFAESSCCLTVSICEGEGA